jgi:hypothetical protein
LQSIFYFTRPLRATETTLFGVATLSQDLAVYPLILGAVWLSVTGVQQATISTRSIAVRVPVAPYLVAEWVSTPSVAIQPETEIPAQLSGSVAQALLVSPI